MFEAIGLLVGGFVIAVMTETLFEQRSANRWLPVRHAMLKHMRDAFAEMGYITTLQLRRGLRLDPLETEDVSAFLTSFGRQLREAKFDKYKWRFPLESDETWRAAPTAFEKRVDSASRVALRFLPIVRAYLPTVASAGDTHLATLLTEIAQVESMLGYIQDRKEAGEDPTVLASASKSVLADLLELGSQLTMVATEELGFEAHPQFDEESYAEELRLRKERGIS